MRKKGAENSERALEKAGSLLSEHLWSETHIFRDCTSICFCRGVVQSFHCGKHNHQGMERSLFARMGQAPTTITHSPRGNHQSKMWTSFKARQKNYRTAMVGIFGQKQVIILPQLLFFFRRQLDLCHPFMTKNCRPGTGLSW